MRQHDQMFGEKQTSKYGSHRVLKGAVNNDPQDLIFKKSDFLAAEDRLLHEARSTKLKRKVDKERNDGHLRTKSNLRAIEAIERRKEFLVSEEKRIRLQRMKDFSVQVRDSFLPSNTNTGAFSKQRDTDLSKHGLWGENNFDMSNFSSAREKSPTRPETYAMDAPHLQIRKVDKSTVATLNGKGNIPAPKPSRSGKDWIAQVLEPDKEEKQLADVYEVAFSSFF